MSFSTVYVITGASRGIGLAIVRELCSRFSNSVKIIGCVRDPSKVPLLDEVAQKHPGVIDIVKYEAASPENNKSIVREIQAKYGRVDTLIANAGILNYSGPASELPIDELREHVEVNSIAPLVLFQAFLPLLKASSNPKYIPISSGAGSIAYVHAPAGQACYGGSKILLNYITRKIHFENEWLTSFPLSPGIVATDMARANIARDKSGFVARVHSERSISEDQAGGMLVDIIDGSTRQTHGGEFINYDGSKIPW